MVTKMTKSLRSAVSFTTGGSYGEPARQRRLREFFARYEQFLEERPETTKELQDLSKALLDLVNETFEKVKQLQKLGKLSKFKIVDPKDRRRNDERMFAKYKKDGNEVSFRFACRLPGATTLRREIVYNTEQKKGRISTWNRAPAGLSEYLLEVSFWTDEDATAKGAFWREPLSGENLMATVTLFAQQLEDALRRIEVFGGTYFKQ